MSRPQSTQTNCRICIQGQLIIVIGTAARYGPWPSFLVQFLPPIVLTSWDTQPVHLVLGLPLALFPSGIVINAFFTILSSSILCRCTAHFNIFENQTGADLGMAWYPFLGSDLSPTIQRSVEGIDPIPGSIPSPGCFRDLHIALFSPRNLESCRLLHTAMTF